MVMFRLFCIIYWNFSWLNLTDLSTFWRLCCCRSIRVQFRADVIFTRQLDNGDEMRVPGYFSSIPQDVNSTQSVDLNELARELSAQVDNWNSRGSGFVIERIIKFTICITKCRPLHGSSYIPTPPKIANKTCSINIKNNDDKCFLWSVLACLHPPSNHTEWLYHYHRYQDTLNVDALNFPLAIKDIPKFEKLNPSISINVLSLDEGDFCIEYCSPERQWPHHVNLLLLSESGRRQNKTSECYTCMQWMSPSFLQ